MEVLGVFRFDCAGYNTPYQKAQGPYVPVTLEELRRVIPVPLPDPPKFSGFCFREKGLIQPIQWMPSSTWGDESWTDEEGRRHRKDGTIES